MKRQSVSGLSQKTQLLYCIIYCTRYLDLLDHRQAPHSWLSSILPICGNIPYSRMSCAVEGGYDVFPILFLGSCVVWAEGGRE